MECNKILIAVDSSEISFKAAIKAMNFANKFKSDIGIVFVIETIRAVSSPDIGYMAIDMAEKSREDAKKIVSTLKKTYAKSFKPTAPIKTFFPEGNPWQKIIETAETWQPDVISIATHGRTGLSKLFMGSIAEAVVRHSKVPVMVFPADFLT